MVPKCPSFDMLSFSASLKDGRPLKRCYSSFVPTISLWGVEPPDYEWLLMMVIESASRNCLHFLHEGPKIIIPFRLRTLRVSRSSVLEETGSLYHEWWPWSSSPSRPVPFVSRDPLFGSSSHCLDVKLTYFPWMCILIIKTVKEFGEDGEDGEMAQDWMAWWHK